MDSEQYEDEPPPLIEDPYDELDDTVFRFPDFDDDDSDDGFGPRLDSLSQQPSSPKQSFSQPQVSTSSSSSSAALNELWESQLASVQTFAVPRREFLLPWETGFAGLVLGKSSTCVPNIRLPVPFIPTSSASSSKEPVPLPQALDSAGTWAVVTRRLKGISWDDQKEAMRSRALLRIQKFFQESPEHTGLGRLLMRDILSLESESHLVETLRDVFSRKATRTLNKRARSLTNFLLFAKLRGQCVLPISESLVYNYLSTECSQSPSKGQQFLEALNFTKDTLQCDGVAEATSSPRVKGFCFKQLVTKRPYKQADVLSVSMVSALERIVLTESDYFADRIFAGHCCLCIHGRFRWSDAQSISSLKLDVAPDGSGFLQAFSIGETKTSTTAAKKTTFLPLTALIGGISTDRWAQKWISLREDSGLELKPGMPVMPSVTASGRFSEHPLDTDSATKILRELLMRAGFSWEQVCRISTHSLKTTALSWAAKYGMVREARQVLGYHIVGSASALHYARDEQAGPLRKLEEVYADIRSGSFVPDSTRSGYRLRIKNPTVWPELKQVSFEADPPLLVATAKRSPKKQKTSEEFPFDATASIEGSPALAPSDLGPDSEDPAIDLEGFVEEVEADTSTTDSQISDGDDLVDEEIADIDRFDTPLAIPIRAPVKLSGSKLYVHCIYSTVHKSHASDNRKLACGRILHEGFIPHKPECNLDRPYCITCFGSKEPPI